jgi:hypothetical protein
MSVESPDLKIGTTFAVFIWSGISPEANDKFTMCFKGMQIRFDTFLSNTMDRLDGSRLCLGLSWSITSIISCEIIGLDIFRKAVGSGAGG